MEIGVRKAFQYVIDPHIPAGKYSQLYLVFKYIRQTPHHGSGSRSHTSVDLIVVLHPSVQGHLFAEILSRIFLHGCVVLRFRNILQYLSETLKHIVSRHLELLPQGLKVQGKLLLLDRHLHSCEYLKTLLPHQVLKLSDPASHWNRPAISLKLSLNPKGTPKQILTDNPDLFLDLLVLEAKNSQQEYENR